MDETINVQVAVKASRDETGKKVHRVAEQVQSVNWVCSTCGFSTPARREDG